MSRVSQHAQAFVVAIMILGLHGLSLETTAMSSTGVEPAGDDPGAQRDGSGLPARALLRIGTDTLRIGGNPGEIAFSPDGKYIAAPNAWRGGLPGVSLFDVHDGRRVRQLRAADPPAGFVQCLAFSADGMSLLWGESNGHVALWDLKTDRALFRAKLHSGGVEAVAFSADGKTMASGGEEGAVHLRHVENLGKAMRDFEIEEHRTAPAPVDPAGVRCIAFTPDGTRLIAGAGLSGDIFVWQVSDGQLLRRIEGPPGKPNPANQTLQNRPRLDRVEVMPDGLRLISTGQRLARNPRQFDPRTRQMWVTDVRFWELETGQCLAVLDGGDEPFKGQAAVMRNGKLAVLSDPYRLRILDPSMGVVSLKIDLPGQFPSRTVLSPDGSLLATSLDGRIALFDVRTGRALHQDDQTPTGELLSAAWSPSGDRVVTGHGDGGVRLWDARTGHLLWHRLLAPLLNPWGQVASPMFVAFSHDGRRIVVGGFRDQSSVAGPGTTYEPGIVAVYAANGDLLMSKFFPRAIYHAALSTDSKILVIAPPDPVGGPSPNAAELRGIELETGKTLWTSLPGERHPALDRLAQRDVRAMRFQPASTALDVAMVTGEVVRLDALTGKEQRRFVADWRSPEAKQSERSAWPSMWHAAFSGDGRSLVSATDEFVYVWNVGTGQLRLSIRRPHKHTCYLALAPDGKTLATSDVSPYQGNWGDDTIRVYDADTGAQTMTFEPDDDRATILCFSPDGTRLLTGLHRAAALVWDLHQGSSDPATKK